MKISKAITHVVDVMLLNKHHVKQEFLPDLRAAVKASGVSGMSCSKAAVVNISSVLGSMDFMKDLYALFSAVSYRVSKVSDDLYPPKASSHMC